MAKVGGRASPVGFERQEEVTDDLTRRQRWAIAGVQACPECGVLEGLGDGNGRHCPECHCCKACVDALHRLWSREEAVEMDEDETRFLDCGECLSAVGQREWELEQEREMEERLEAGEWYGFSYGGE